MALIGSYVEFLESREKDAPGRAGGKFLAKFRPGLHLDGAFR
jgi:hypothetical protein